VRGVVGSVQVRCGVEYGAAGGKGGSWGERGREGEGGGARIMASAVASARKCDMVSSPTLARPLPPVMASTVGPAPER
jgi:hypothetical protein